VPATTAQVASLQRRKLSRAACDSQKSIRAASDGVQLQYEEQRQVSGGPPMCAPWGPTHRSAPTWLALTFRSIST